jgi:hypothetical protein
MLARTGGTLLLLACWLTKGEEPPQHRRGAFPIICYGVRRGLGPKYYKQSLKRLPKRSVKK